MTITRKYYEALLNLMEKLVSIKSRNFIELNSIRIELSELIRKIKNYNVFELNLAEDFFSAIEKNDASEFDNIQSRIAEELYNSLGELLYSFETTDRETDYGRALELYRTELSFTTVNTWKVKTNPDGKFRMEMLFFDLNRKWTEIDSEDQYLEYKKQIREKKTPIRFEKELKKIPKDKHEKIRLHFENVYNQYQKYIFENYPTISNEFSLYNSVVRIYIIDRKGQPGESTMQLNVYKSTDGRTSITVASQFYDFISRFSNLEEIEHTPVVCSLSLFQIDNPAKYNFQFDIPSIHRELSQIFIRNSNEQNLKDFLLFLLRTELKSVYQIEGYNNELQINRNQYCKLFLSNVPNLNAIRKELQVREDGQKYSFAIFTSRPDEETLSLLKSHEIEPIFIDRLAREHINNQNGEIIDWYVKSKLDRFEIKKSNDKENLSETLIQRLENCPTGLKGWMDYENICTEIFNYLFQNDFRNYIHKVQSYTHDNIFRRDLIVNNNFCDATSVWGQAKTDFNCNLIVVDFKNYENPLEQNEFYLPSKYLNLITGNFGLVISRKGLGNSAKLLQKKMFNLNKQLLLSIEDKDLIGMLRDKALNLNPSYRLENLIFSLYEEL